MGDRSSVSFRHSGAESVTLNSHWRGRGLFADARKYAREVRKKYFNNGPMPINRLDVEVVMVDFIRHLTKDMEVVDGDLRVSCST